MPSLSRMFSTKDRPIGNTAAGTAANPASAAQARRLAAPQTAQPIVAAPAAASTAPAQAAPLPTESVFNPRVQIQDWTASVAPEARGAVLSTRLTEFLGFELDLQTMGADMAASLRSVLQGAQREVFDLALQAIDLRAPAAETTGAPITQPVAPPAPRPATPTTDATCKPPPQPGTEALAAAAAEQSVAHKRRVITPAPAPPLDIAGKVISSLGLVTPAELHGTDAQQHGFIDCAALASVTTQQWLEYAQVAPKLMPKVQPSLQTDVARTWMKIAPAFRPNFESMMPALNVVDFVPRSALRAFLQLLPDVPKELWVMPPRRRQLPGEPPIKLKLPCLVAALQDARSIKDLIDETPIGKQRALETFELLIETVQRPEGSRMRERSQGSAVAAYFARLAGTSIDQRVKVAADTSDLLLNNVWAAPASCVTRALGEPLEALSRYIPALCETKNAVRFLSTLGHEATLGEVLENLVALQGEAKDRVSKVSVSIQTAINARTPWWKSFSGNGLVMQTLQTLIRSDREGQALQALHAHLQAFALLGEHVQGPEVLLQNILQLSHAEFGAALAISGLNNLPVGIPTLASAKVVHAIARLTPEQVRVLLDERGEALVRSAAHPQGRSGALGDLNWLQDFCAQMQARAVAGNVRLNRPAAIDGLTLEAVEDKERKAIYLRARAQLQAMRVTVTRDAARKMLVDFIVSPAGNKLARLTVPTTFIAASGAASAAPNSVKERALHALALMQARGTSALELVQLVFNAMETLRFSSLVEKIKTHELIKYTVAYEIALCVKEDGSDIVCGNGQGQRIIQAIWGYGFNLPGEPKVGEAPVSTPSEIVTAMCMEYNHRWANRGGEPSAEEIIAAHADLLSRGRPTFAGNAALLQAFESTLRASFEGMSWHLPAAVVVETAAI